MQGGRLVRPFDIALPAPYAYWIVSPQATAGEEKVAAFREWLLLEAERQTCAPARIGAA
jgi:LysR family transcriptional regulator, glycine cleavage system transcriptional activator